MSPVIVTENRALAALRESPIPALRRLEVEETEITVTITGSVPSYYTKQLAQETLMPLLAGRKLLNHVAVVRQLLEAPA
jgi:hypothetical protein